MTHEKTIRAECAKRGISIQRKGSVWKLYGPDVDILATDFRTICLSDLLPKPPNA